MVHGCSRILLVDDSAVLRKMVAASILSLGGYEVEQASDAIEALMLMDECACDVIITDLYMPGIDGIEFARRVRSRPDCRSVGIAMITMERDPFVESEARAAGVDEFLIKPVDPVRLREVMDRLTSCAEGTSSSARIDAHAVLDCLPFPAMVLDGQRNVVIGNTSFWAQSGAGLDDRGLTCCEVMHACGAPPAECPLADAVASGNAAVACLGGESRPSIVSVYPMDLTDGAGGRLYLHLSRPAQ